MAKEPYLYFRPNSPSHYKLNRAASQNTVEGWDLDHCHYAGSRIAALLSQVQIEG